MLALTVETAKTAAVVVALVFIGLAVVSAWLVKNIVTKVILVVVLGGLALGAWTQRTSLQDCADRAAASFQNGTAGVDSVTCTFFGTDVNVPAP